MGDLIAKYWAPFWALLTTAALITMAFLAKTYAKKEDVQAVVKKVNQLEAKLDAMPSQEQVTSLLIALEKTNGRIESLSEKIKPIEHLSRLLLEQRLNE